MSQAATGAFEDTKEMVVVDHRFGKTVVVDVAEEGVRGGGVFAVGPVRGLGIDHGVLDVGRVLVLPAADGPDDAVVPGGFVQVGHHHVPTGLGQVVVRRGQQRIVGVIPQGAVVLAVAPAAGAVAVAVATVDTGHEARPVGVPAVVAATVAVEAANFVVGAGRQIHGIAVEVGIHQGVGQFPGVQPAAFGGALADHPVVGVVGLGHDGRPAAHLGHSFPIFGKNSDAELARTAARQTGQDVQRGLAIAADDVAGEVAVARNQAQAVAVLGVDLMIVVAAEMHVIIQDDAVNAMVQPVVANPVAHAIAGVTRWVQPHALGHPGHRRGIAVAAADHLGLDLHGPIVHFVVHKRHHVLAIG